MGNKVLELYSGIGGMHCALIESCVSGEIVAAADINTVANNVYKHNFPKTTLLNRNIESITVEQISKLGINTILMSPPCQPFTRNGKYLDEKDARTTSFTHIIESIEQLSDIEYILLENVKGFECSSIRDKFIAQLQICKFQYQEFLLCPSSFGIPNSRMRYYCIARRTKTVWPFQISNSIMTTLPNHHNQPWPLKQVITDEETNKFLLPDKLLKRANVLDICNINSKRSCCFTKAYSHYVEGTGSVYTNADPDTVELCYQNANKYTVGSEEFLSNLRPLQLRFFTPKEVSSIMCFPEKYEFPQEVTRKQCYRLLGNSVNVKVIGELIKILFL